MSNSSNVPRVLDEGKVAELMRTSWIESPDAALVMALEETRCPRSILLTAEGYGWSGAIAIAARVIVMVRYLGVAECVHVRISEIPDEGAVVEFSPMDVLGFNQSQRAYSVLSCSVAVAREVRDCECCDEVAAAPKLRAAATAIFTVLSEAVNDVRNDLRSRALPGQWMHIQADLGVVRAPSWMLLAQSIVGGRGDL